MGAGVPRLVQPKSQTQRTATANPSTDGIAASHRQRATPASTLKPSHRGSSQNHRAKNAAPTASEAIAVGYRFQCDATGLPDRSPAIDPPVVLVFILPWGRTCATV